MTSDTKPGKTSKIIIFFCLFFLTCSVTYTRCGQFCFPPTFRFIVRDFQYNEEEMKADKEEMNRLSTDKKKQFVCVLNIQYYQCYAQEKLVLLLFDLKESKTQILP